jgi:hypothetical protein
MKKTALILSAALLVASLLSLAACGGDDPAAGSTTTAGVSGGLVTTSSEPVPADGGQAVSTTETTQATPASSGGSGDSDRAFAPFDLLSAEEATTLVGQPVSLEDASVYKDEERGVISATYKYDLESSTIHALVEIHQDGLRTGSGSVKDDFLFEKDLGKSEITAVADLGDDAFTHGQGQLHLLYGSYYIVVAFDADAYATTGNAALNVKIGTMILENLKAKLG